MRWVAALAAIAAMACPWARADIVWDFESGVSGWRLTDHQCSSSYISVIKAYTATWVASGGNPGAFIQGTDPTGNCFFFDAPSVQLGDWSAYGGGCLEFSMKSNVKDWPNDNAVALIGNNGVSLVARVLPLPAPEWVTYVIRLVPASFRKNGLNGAPATEADLNAVLASVANLRISAEYGSEQGEETVGLDSVKVTRRRTFGVRDAHTSSPALHEAARRHWFRMWGRVSQVTADSFVLDDASGRPVRELAPGHGLTAGAFAVAEGLLDPLQTPPVLTSSASAVRTP